jgi:ferredoxin
VSWLSLFPLILLGHLFSSHGQVKEVSRFQYWSHTLYALSEPLILKAADFMTTNRFFTGTRIGRFMVWYIARTNVWLPHGVVIPTGVAIHLLRDVEKYSGGEGHIAVGPCVCQTSLDKYSEPTRKDMTIWYGSEIYRRHYKDYELITADEGAAMLRDFHKKGLVHVIESCMQSTKWMFVLCNCDREICCPVRVYNITGRTCLPGPYVAAQKHGCLGPEKCGACIERCIFNANRIEGDTVVLDTKQCLGCGLCVTTCNGGVRSLDRRGDYRGKLLPSEYFEGAKTED